MPYYNNTNVIKSTKIATLTGVYDTDYARHNKVAAPGGGALIAINFALSEDNTTNTALPGTQARYAASPGTIIPTTLNYAFNSGYHYFDLPAGTYSVLIKGAEGSGNNHGLGAIINATLVVVASTRFVALVGNYGTGQYSGGGMTAIALRNSGSFDVYTSAIPILVAGGGGGGYGSQATVGLQAWGGSVDDDPTIRRGVATDGPGGLGVYDGGAAFSNVYSPIRYNNVTGVQGDVGAQHFVWGGLGGRATACETIFTGGFGGGGGACPGGGGGYYGGKAGGDSPSQSQGGGGTSYRLASGSVAYISSWSGGGGNGNTAATFSGYNGTNKGSGGFFSITPV